MAGPLTPQQMQMMAHHMTNQGNLQPASAQPPQMAPPVTMSQQTPQQTASAEQRFDLIVRVRSLVWTLKESLANLMKIAASNIHHNSQIDSGIKISEENVTRFDKAMEDFLSICNQIELHLKTIMECTVQARDSQMYLPFAVSANKFEPTDTTATDNTISYGQYLNTIKSQINFAKTVHDLLLEGSKRISQNETLSMGTAQSNV